MAKQANPEGMKWPTDKARYDKNYLRLFGKVCSECSGIGIVDGDGIAYKCINCNGLGYVMSDADSTQEWE